MSEGLHRTTISIDEALYKAAEKRASALGYKAFSQYVAYLIEKDVRERGQHITVREESGQPWGKSQKKRSSG
jgi:hypothetical protein